MTPLELHAALRRALVTCIALQYGAASFIALAAALGLYFISNGDEAFYALGLSILSLLTLAAAVISLIFTWSRFKLVWEFSAKQTLFLNHNRLLYLDTALLVAGSIVGALQFDFYLTAAALTISAGAGIALMLDFLAGAKIAELLINLHR